MSKFQFQSQQQQQADKMRKGDSEYDLRKLEQAKVPVLFLNAFVLVVALVNWALCIWIRVDLDFRRWVQEIEW